MDGMKKNFLHDVADINTKQQHITPFLKWAGGKRWLVTEQKLLFPSTYNRYIEPFLGSAAVFFYLSPKRALLSDTNRELISTYIAIRDDWGNVLRELRKHQKNHCKNYYYLIRGRSYRTPAAQAAQFIYLNRTCWNGLYRVNLDGQFNVPIGTKDQVLLASDNFESVARCLHSAKIIHSDFEPIINQARRDDFIFVDPPYTVKHNFNNFIKYNEKLFSWDDQVRLKECLVKAKSRGAKILVTNAFHKSVKDLYKDLGMLIPVKRHSVIAADSTRRKICEELVIRV